MKLEIYQLLKDIDNATSDNAVLDLIISNFSKFELYSNDEIDLFADALSKTQSQINNVILFLALPTAYAVNFIARKDKSSFLFKIKNQINFRSKLEQSLRLSKQQEWRAKFVPCISLSYLFVQLTSDVLETNSFFFWDKFYRKEGWPKSHEDFCQNVLIQTKANTLLLWPELIKIEPTLKDFEDLLVR
jgi:hypothetical protein